jgi:hypothetical protein
MASTWGECRFLRMSRWSKHSRRTVPDEPLGVGVRPRSLDRVLMMRKPLEVELALHREWPHPVFALITPLESDP